TAYFDNAAQWNVTSGCGGGGMINTQTVTTTLKNRYPDLEFVEEGVFRAFERYQGTPYAVRYFDLRDNLVSIADNLRVYQDELLGSRYFDPATATDLRWNHYLYFIASQKQPNLAAFSHAKAAVESNREYARKQ